MNEEQEWLMFFFFIFATLALAAPGTKWCSIDAVCSHVALPRRPEGPRVGHSSSNNQSRLKCTFVVTMCWNWPQRELESKGMLGKMPVRCVYLHLKVHWRGVEMDFWESVSLRQISSLNCFGFKYMSLRVRAGACVIIIAWVLLFQRPTKATYHVLVYRTVPLANGLSRQLWFFAWIVWIQP